MPERTPRKSKAHEEPTEAVFRKLFPKTVRERAALEVERAKKPKGKSPTEKDSN